MDEAERREKRRLYQQRWRENNLDQHREIARSWYSRNKKRQQDRQRNTYAKNKAILSRFKRMKGCAICGFKAHSAALVFHHVDPSQKKGEVTNMIRFGMKSLREEIAKCVVLCANCHAMTHHPDEDKEAA